MAYVGVFDELLGRPERELPASRSAGPSRHPDNARYVDLTDPFALRQFVLDRTKPVTDVLREQPAAH